MAEVRAQSVSRQDVQRVGVFQPAGEAERGQGVLREGETLRIIIFKQVSTTGLPLKPLH